MKNFVLRLLTLPILSVLIAIVLVAALFNTSLIKNKTIEKLGNWVSKYWELKK